MESRKIYFILNKHSKLCFVILKSELVPANKKSKSIPQLELQAALIVSLLKQKFTKQFEIPIKETFMWTDSKIVLSYLQNEDRNVGVYIRHRKNKILENTELNE